MKTPTRTLSSARSSNLLDKKNITSTPKTIQEVTRLKIYKGSYYHVLAVTDDNRIIAKDINTGYLYQIDRNFNILATLNTEGLFYLESKGLLLNSGTLLVFNAGSGKIYRSTDTTYTAFTEVFAFRTNCVILINRGWDKTPDDVVMFGEYSTIIPRDPSTARLYMSADDGQTWSIAHEFSRDTSGADYIRHIHTVCYDKYTGKFWISTGDGDPAKPNDAINGECRIYTINPDGTGLTLIGSGSQIYRCVSFVFTEDLVLWGTDGPVWENQYPSFMVYARASGQIDYGTPHNLSKTIFGCYEVEDSSGNTLYIACDNAYTTGDLIGIWVYNEETAEWELGLTIDRKTGADGYYQIQDVVDVGGGRLMVTGEGIHYWFTDYVKYSFALDIVKETIISS